MSDDDRFGLKGDPEVREARRMPFGPESVSTAALVLATATGVLLAVLAVIGGWSLSSAVLWLSVPVAGWGWWVWFKARSHGKSVKNLGLTVYLMMISLRYGSEFVADLQAGETLGGWKLTVFLVIVMTLIYLAVQSRRT